MNYRSFDSVGVRWWAALVIVLSFILVARTGTVGAPADAMGADDRHGTVFGGRAASPMRFGSSSIERAPSQVSFERHLRHLEEELALVRGELAAERERAALLATGYDDLETKFESVTTSILGAAGDTVPRPVEAIYVLEPADATTQNPGDPR